MGNIYDYFFPKKAATKRNLRGETPSSKEILSSIEGNSISPQQLQSFIDLRRSEAANGFVDLSELSGLALQGETLVSPFDDADDRVSNIDLGDIQIFSDLNISHTNFPEVFSMNSSYFQRSDLSGLRFKNMESVFFEGCRLTGSDMSNTQQSNLYLSGLTSYFLARGIRSLDSELHYYRDEMTDAEYATNLQKAQQLKRAYAQLQPTQVNKVNLDGVRFVNGVWDDWLTDYQGTNFSKVTFDFPHAELIGRNIDFSGASYKLQDGSYYEIKDAISAEEVERRSGPYMAAMLRNNIIQPRGEKKTVFAMLPTGLNSDVTNSTNRCNDVFGSGPTYAPINMADMQQIVHSFNQTYGAEFNAEFVADDGLTPYDYRITLCETWDAPRYGLQTPNIALVDRENYIEISRVFTNVAALSHEFFHILGGNHPFDAGVLPTKSSHFATVLSYSNAVDLMLPIAGETSPLSLSNYQSRDPFTHQGIAAQDRDFLTIILGANPNFQPQDVTTSIHSGMTRIVHADKDRNNTAVIDKSWGMEKYVVLDASQSIGTCFKFPCDPNDMAAGITGTLVVFYDDSGSEVRVTGNVLLFGGKVNQVIADGQVIEPIKPAPKPLVNGANVTVAEFQAEIYQRKMRSDGEVVDLSDLRDVVIQTKTIATDSYNKIENVIEGIDVSGTNFATVFNLDGKYFKNCNFAGVRFGNTTDTSFDGCDLTGADMSNTVQIGLALGADLDDIANYIGGADQSIHDNWAGNFYSEAWEAKYLEDIKSYREFEAAVKPTKFVNVNLRGAILKKSSNIYAPPSDNYLTDYNQTDFSGVEIVDNFVLQGQNLNLKGAIFRTNYSELRRDEVAPIVDPISAKEVASRAGSYVEAMVRNNVIHRRDGGQKTTIAVASALQESDQIFFDKCSEIYPYNDVSYFRAVNVTDLQDLADIYNSEFGTKHNVEFVVDAPNQNRDFRLNICFNNYAGAGEAGSLGLLDPELYINLGYGATRQTKLHEFGHILGAYHPFEEGIDPTKCSVMASVMCYANAIDIMLPLGNSPKPARLSYDGQENLAPQDHKFVSFLFGENPTYQPQNYQANIAVGQNRIIYGDAGYNNTASLDTSSLPEGVKWIVLDAAKSIGTCYKFPCREEDLAEGLSGNMLVLYKENISGGSEVLGSTLLFGGATNDFFVDGQKIEPFSPDFSLSLSPTSKPTQTPTIETATPTGNPTQTPTTSPTQTPTIETATPTGNPTQTPTIKTAPPTGNPTQTPTAEDPSQTFNRDLVLKICLPLAFVVVGAVLCSLKRENRDSLQEVRGGDLGLKSGHADIANPTSPNPALKPQEFSSIVPHLVGQLPVPVVYH